MHVTRRQALKLICGKNRRYPNKRVACMHLRPGWIAHSCARCMHWHVVPETPELLRLLASIPETGRVLCLQSDKSNIQTGDRYGTTDLQLSAVDAGV